MSLGTYSQGEELREDVQRNHAGAGELWAHAHARTRTRTHTHGHEACSKTDTRLSVSESQIWSSPAKFPWAKD